MLSNTKVLARRMLHHAGVLSKIARAAWRGYTKWRKFSDWNTLGGFMDATAEPNPLQAFFAARKEGRGIWKWNHYFEIYDRHFNRFRGRDVHILEIGIYSGGSLEMWRSYFGPRCRIYGVDIEPACKKYEGDSVRVFIGDQADRDFWKRFREEVPVLDIVVDDGGHVPEQQIVTLEELLPHLRPGGVFVCEDVGGAFNEFASYVYGMAQNMNAWEPEFNLGNNERRNVNKTKALQSAVGSIHLYSYMTVIERTAATVLEFVAPKHGTQWEPFPGDEFKSGYTET
jgi:23S rRNA U2552 (ribose-2'-O)-methylase RlmE/FtsJ